jgi:hypothetical protein
MQIFGLAGVVIVVKMVPRLRIVTWLVLGGRHTVRESFAAWDLRPSLQVPAVPGGARWPPRSLRLLSFLSSRRSPSPSGSRSPDTCASSPARAAPGPCPWSRSAADIETYARELEADGRALPVSRPRPARTRRLRRAASRALPHRRGVRRQRHGERVQHERDQRVVPAQRHQLHHPGVADKAVGGVVGLLVQAALLTELAGHCVDGTLVIRLERRILAAPDGVHHSGGDAMLASHRACAHHSNSACQRAPVVMMAISDRRRSIDVPNRSSAPSEDSRRPAPSAVTNALNGPAKAPSAVTTTSPRPSTIPSHSCWPSGPSSSRRRYGIRLITRTLTTGRSSAHRRDPEHGQVQAALSPSTRSQANRKVTVCNSRQSQQRANRRSGRFGPGKLLSECARIAAGHGSL